MNKYAPLTDYLKRHPGDVIIVPFDYFGDQDVIGVELPESAKRFRQWWENQSEPGSRHCRAWLDAGFEVESVDFEAERVVFRRKR